MTEETKKDLLLAELSGFMSEIVRLSDGGMLTNGEPGMLPGWIADKLERYVRQIKNIYPHLNGMSRQEYGLEKHMDFVKIFTETT